MRSIKETKVLEAATAVFLRYGYRRTTMGDIASAAGISRPALYLLFCNKERIFQAVLRRHAVGSLEAIQAGIAQLGSPMEKLRTAFEFWVVEPFSLMLESPDARDLMHCGYEFAGETLELNSKAFETLLVSILDQFPSPRPTETPSSERIAHILSVSARGFKGAARDVQELRDMIDALLEVTAASLRPVT